MLDQLVIGNKASYDDFEATVKERKINTPAKKVIKETVPFSNKTYDFSGINGEFYWEERTLEYILEIIAMTPEELEEKKLGLKTWLMNTSEELLYDPFIEDYHFIATYDSSDFDDSEVEKSTITVTFTAYPYMIANAPKEYGVAVEAGAEKTLTMMNESSHKVTPTIISDVDIIVQKDDSSYGVPAGETTDDSFKLSVGINELVIQNPNETTATIKITFSEEVF